MCLLGLECHLAFRRPAKWFGAPQHFEEGKVVLSRFCDEATEGREAAGQVLYFFQIGGRRNFYDGTNLARIGLDASSGDEIS